MSYERKLWSRQELSFPYIVVCRSASRILMLSWRGCRASSLCKMHDLGPVALWENRSSCKREGMRVPPGCGSSIASHSRDCATMRDGGREVGSVLSSIINSRDYPSLGDLLQSPTHFLLLLPFAFSPQRPPFPSHTLFSLPSFCQPFDSALIPHILP